VGDFRLLFSSPDSDPFFNHKSDFPSSLSCKHLTQTVLSLRHTLNHPTVVVFFSRLATRRGAESSSAGGRFSDPGDTLTFSFSSAFLTTVQLPQLSGKYLTATGDLSLVSTFSSYGHPKVNFIPAQSLWKMPRSGLNILGLVKTPSFLGPFTFLRVNRKQ
jgi:hypothetical protein